MKKIWLIYQDENQRWLHTECRNSDEAERKGRELALRGFKQQWAVEADNLEEAFSELRMRNPNE